MKKALKWIGIIILILISLFLLLLFILNLLFGYKDSDFNIPEDFFDTPHQNEVDSEKNGYKDFADLVDYEDNPNVSEEDDKLGDFYELIGPARYDYSNIDITLNLITEDFEKVENNLKETEELILQKIGKEKYNYLNNYFTTTLETRALGTHNLEFVRNREDFQKNNLSKDEIYDFLTFFNEKNKLKENKYNVEEIKNSMENSLLAKIFWKLDYDLIFNYENRDGYTNEENEQRYKDEYENYIEKLKKKKFTEKEIQKIEELNKIENELNISFYNTKSLNKKIEELILGVGISEDIKNIVENNKDELEKLKEIINNFDNKFYNSSKEGFKEFSEFIDKINVNMEKIMKEKEFIVSTKCDDVRTKEEIMSYTIKFFRKSLSIANVYIKEGKFEKGIDILLKQREFLDYIINKVEKITLIESLIIRNLDNISIFGLEYIIENYNIPEEEQKRIIEILNNEIKYGLIDNGLKCEYKSQKPLLENVSNFFNFVYQDYKNYYGEKVSLGYKRNLHKFLSIFFYSKNETLALHKKIYYDIITNKGEFGELRNNADNRSFKFQNPHNFIGRIIIMNNISSIIYSSQYQKEDEMHQKREELIKKIEENLK